jgi:uncharacterized protein YdeI (YjbR/CyaY-like superfamily)
MNSHLTELKTRFSKFMKWGQQYSTTNDDDSVLQVAWMDHQVVLFMTTVDEANTTIQKAKKRPRNNKPYVKKVWGQEPVKILDIPTFIDRYNHHMNSVDVADQLRGYYSPDRHTFRIWRPPFDYLLHTAVSNASILWIGIGNEKTKNSGALKFRQQLTNQLLSHSESQNLIQPAQKLQKEEILRSQAIQALQALPEGCDGHHKYIFKGVRQCAMCKAAGRLRIQKKQALGESSASELNKQQSQRQRPSRTHFGCDSCKIAICHQSLCWQAHTKR